MISSRGIVEERDSTAAGANDTDDSPLIAYGADLEGAMWAARSGDPVEDSRAYQRAVGLDLDDLRRWLATTEPEYALPGVSLVAMSLRRIRALIADGVSLRSSRITDLYRSDVELFASERETSLRVGLAVACSAHCRALTPIETANRLGLDLRGLWRLVTGQLCPDMRLAEAIDSLVGCRSARFVEAVGGSAADAVRRLDDLRKELGSTRPDSSGPEHDQQGGAAYP